MSENLAYRDGFREELIGGKIVMMSPASTNHNRISGNIYRIFANFLHRKTCVPFGDGEKVFLTSTDHYVPDFMVICDRDKIKPDGVHGTPDLVVEILSPSTGVNDRSRKKSVYEESGVPEYWIVSPKEKSIEVYLLSDGHYTLDNTYFYHSAEDMPYLTDDEKAALVTEFKCHLYDDLLIPLDDIFGDLF